MLPSERKLHLKNANFCMKILPFGHQSQLQTQSQRSFLWHRGLVFSGYYSCTTNSISQISLRLVYCYQALCEKCLYSELFCSVFSHNQTEYGDLLFKTPYSVQKRETKDAVSMSEGRNKKTYEYAVITFFLLNIY